MAKNRLPAADVTEDPHYHDTWTLLRKYRDVVWSLEVSVRQVRNRFRIDYGKTIEDFLESVYLAGADLSGTELEHQAKCIEQSPTIGTGFDGRIPLDEVAFGVVGLSIEPKMVNAYFPGDVFLGAGTLI